MIKVNNVFPGYSTTLNVTIYGFKKNYFVLVFILTVINYCVMCGTKHYEMCCYGKINFGVVTAVMNEHGEKAGAE